MPKKSKEEIDKMSNEELESYLNEQLEFYKNTINFVKKATKEIGRRTKYDEHSDYTHIIDEVENIEGFHLIYDRGHTMFGGTYIKIESDDKGLLKLYYQLDDGLPQVEYHIDGPWEYEFKSLMKRGDEVINKYKIEMEKNKKKEEEQRAREIIEKKKRADAIKKLKKMQLYS